MTVTVGLPFHDDGQRLALAIASVFAQSYRDWRLVLVDDGSQDGSLRLARAVDDPRVQVLSDGKNLGLATRLNQIARLAAGSYLARMDADDIMHPERLLRQVRHLDAHPSIDVLATAAYVIDNHDKVYGVRVEGEFNQATTRFLSNAVFIHPTIMGRREWFLRNSYDATMRRAQDKELWCRSQGYTIFDRLTEPLLYYRESGNFRWPHYQATCRADRRIIARYGAHVVGSRRMAMMLAGSHAKERLYQAMLLTGGEDWLVRRRSQPLTADVRAAAQSTLDGMLRVNIPMSRQPPD